jgi:hypothetical protein
MASNKKDYSSFNFDEELKKRQQNQNNLDTSDYGNFDFEGYFKRQNLPKLGEYLSVSVSNWLNKNESFLSSYNNRIGKYTDKDILDWEYESDSADWMSKITTQKNNLEKEATEIKSWLDQYKDYLDKDYYDSVVSALDGNLKVQGDIISKATELNDYWSKFETEDAYKEYVAGQKDYNEKLNFNLEAGKVEIDELQKIVNEMDELQKGINLTYNGYQGGSRGYANEQKRAEYQARLDELTALYGDHKTLKSTLSEKNAYYTLAERVQKAEELASVADVNSENYDPAFEKYASQGKSMDNGKTPWMFFGNTVADNPIEAWRRYYADHPTAEEDYGAGKIGEEASFALAMTEDEVDIYNYYLAKEGKDKAEEYLDLIAESVNSRVASGYFTQVKGKPVLEYAFAVAAGLDQFASGMEGWFADGYTPASSIQYASGMIREDLAETGAQLPGWLGGGSIGQAAYDVVTTTSNMLPSILVSTAANAIAPGSGAVIGAGLLGASAGGNAKAEMLNLGYSKEQANTYGVMVAAAEAGMEYLLGGISKLGGKASGGLTEMILSKVDNAFARTAIKIGSSMLSEGFEEGIQTVIEPWLKEIATGVDWEDPSIDEVLYSSLLGALSAFGLEGAGVVAGEVGTYNQGKTIRNTNGGVGMLQELATNYFSADTVAYKIASKVDAFTDAYTIGRLLNEVGGTISEQNVTDIVNGLVEKGVRKTDAAKLAKQYQAFLNSEMNLSDEQVKILENLSPLADVLRKNIIGANTTVYQRTRAYADIMSLADEVANGKKGVSTQKSSTTEKPTANIFEQQAVNADVQRIASEVASGKSVSGVRQLVKENFESKKSTADAKLGVEGKYTSSETGATRLASNKKKVNVVGVDEINKGTLMLKLDDGSVVNAEEIDFSTADQALVYEAVANMGVNPTTAWEILKGYDPKSGQSGTIYAMGALEAYTYGHNGVKVDGMSKDGFSALLSPTQKNTANRLGDIDARAKVEAQQKTIDKAVKTVRDEAKSKHKAIPKRKGEVVLEGEISRANLTDYQESQIDVLEKMSEGLGVTFHIFKSDENFKYTMPNGAVRSANGWYDLKTGEIWIDLKAGDVGQGTIIFTAAHELTHFIKQWSPAKFKVFADFLMEQYGKKGETLEALIDRRISDLAAHGRTKGLSATEIYDLAYEEIVADSCQTFLRDSKAAEKIAALREKDRSLANKIKTFLGQMLAKMRRILADNKILPESNEAQIVAEMTDSVQKLYDLWTDALADAGEAYSTVGGEIDLDGDSNVHKLSDRTIIEGAGLQFIPDADGVHYQVLDTYGNAVESVTPEIIANSPLGQLVSSAKDNGFLGEGKMAESAAKKQYEFLAELVNMCINYDGLAPIWETAGTMVFSSIKSNADKQYGLTIDFSTVCKKTQAIVDAMSEAMVRLGRGLTRSEVETIYLEVGKAGESTPCPVCYVFSRWMGIGGILDQMSRFQDKYTNKSESELQAFIADIKKRISERANTPNKKGELKKDFFDKNGAIKEGQVIADLKQKANSGAGSTLNAITKNSDTQLQIQELKALMENQDAKEAKKTAAKIKKLEAKLVDVSALEKQFKAHNDAVEEYEAYQWLTRTLMEEVDGKWVKNKQFKPVPKDVLFDLNKGATFAEDYPLSWAFRTGKGASAGKAITPYADARVGEAIQGIASQDVKSIKTGIDLNPFLNGDEKTRQKIIASAIEKQAKQNLIGGQRYQSTSDFRYEYGSDYLITFLEMQAVGAKVQLYTKVIEAVDFLASMGADINLSVMPLSDGYVTLPNGKKKLIYSSVTGIDAEAAIKKAHEYNNVQLILVGISDEHIRLALEGDDVTFVIPFHGSGNSVHQIQALMNLLGENLDVTTAEDYTAVQSDHVSPKQTKEQKAMWDLRVKILTGKASTLSASEISLLDKNAYLKDLYNRFYVNENADEFGINLSKDVAEQIFPYEYWDKSLTYSEADKNGERFKEYCASMGIIPRFSGMNSKGENVGFGDFTNNKGYWKLLIDRPMYDNTYDADGNWTGYGKYHEQKRINCSNFQVKHLDPEYGSATYGEVMSKANDPKKTNMIVDRAIAQFEKFSDRDSTNSENNGIRYMDRNEKVKDATELSVKDLEYLLEQAQYGVLKDSHYIPLRRNTPEFFVEVVKDHSKGSYFVKDYPMAVEVKHIRQNMEEEDGQSYGNHRPHGFSIGDIITISRKMGDPSYIVLQENERYAMVVSFYNKRNKKVVVSIDFANPHSDPPENYKYSQYMNGYNSSYYNIIVTQYEPDDFQDYLSKCEVVYDKTKMNGKYQVGSGRVVTVTHDTPFIEDIIPQPDDSVNRETEKFSGRRDVEPIETSDYVKMYHHFGSTKNYDVAGYILGNGIMLDFSGKHWGDDYSTSRQVDHRDIQEVLGNRGSNNGVNAMIDMIGNGNIRLMPEVGGINLAVKPNSTQMSQLRGYINHFKGEVEIDIDEVGGDTIHSFSYTRGTSSAKVLADIKAYFDEGIVPEQKAEGETDIRQFLYSDRVADKKTRDFLDEQIAKGEYDAETNPDGGYYVTYKSMSFWGYDDEGNAILRSPMAEYVDGKLSGAYLIPKDKNKHIWYQATETIDENTGLPSGLLVKVKAPGKKNPNKLTDQYLPASENRHLIKDDWSNLYFNLKKKIFKNGKWEDSDVPARYNPYEHSSNSMLNDQFAVAYLRDNLVTVKMYVPVSEDNGTYRATWSKDPTGWTDWKTGVVAGKIGQQKDLKRRLYLSRYATPVEIVPDSEVAQAYKGYLEGTDVAIPDNVVPPNLLKELKKIGVPIEESGKVMYSDRSPSSVSTRSLLANALETTAQNDIEKNKLAQYKSKIDLIESEYSKLTELRAKIKELSFAKGARDTKAIKALQFEANQTANRINVYDRQLLNLESTTALKNVLQREKKMAYDKAKKEGKEALAKYREKSAQTIRTLMDKNTESRQKAVERADKTTMRRKIRNLVKELNSLLKNSNKKKNIKAEEQTTVATALALAEVLFNDDIKNEDIVRLGVDSVTEAESILLNEYRDLLDSRDALIAKIESTYGNGMVKENTLTEVGSIEEALAKVKNRISTLNGKLSEVFERERAKLNKATMNAVFDALITEYSNLANSGNDYIKNAYSEVMKTRLETLKKDLDGKIARDMSIYQLAEVYDTFKAIKHMISTSNNIFREGRAEDLATYVSNIQGEIYESTTEPKDMGVVADALASLFNEFSWNNLRPVDAFERLGSKTFEKLFWDYINGMGVAANDVAEARAVIVNAREKYGYSKWNMKLADTTYTTREGLAFKPSLADKLSIYAYSKREGVDGTKQAIDHIVDGGFTYDTGRTYKDVNNGKTYVRRKLSTTYRLSEGNIKSIIDSLTQEQKAYVDAILPYLTDMGKKGNEVSMTLYGIELFGEKMYFPLQSSSDYLSSTTQELGATQTMSSLANSGFTKQTKPGANNPIVLRGFDDVVLDHIEKMSNYHGLVIPIENLRRVFDNVSRDTEKNSLSTKALIGSRYGVEAQKYFAQLLTDFNGGMSPSGAKSFFGKLFSKGKAMSVSANLSVVAQQYFSIIRAMEIVDPKHFTPFLNGEAKKTDMKQYEELLKYAPIAIIKEMNGFDVGSSGRVKDYIGYEGARKDAEYIRKKIDDISMWGAGKMDELGWVTIWKAVKSEVASEQKLTPGTDEFYKACNTRFTEVVTKTQVFDSVASRSGYMRSKYDAVKYATSFMGEPTVVMGRYFVNGINLVRAIKSKDSGKIKEASLHFVRAAAVIATSQVLGNLAKSLIYAGRDDEEDEAFLEKWAKKFAEALVSDLNPLNSLPFTRDIMSIIEGWDVERPDLTLIADAVTSTKKMFDGDITFDESLNFIGAAGNLFGIPFKNVIREIKSAVNVVDDIFVDDISPTDMGGAFVEGLTGEERTKKTNLYNAIVSGDTGKIEAIKGTYKTDTAYESAVKSALRENDPRIKKAVKDHMSGNIRGYSNYIDTIAAEGHFDAEMVESAIRAEESAFNTKISEAAEAKAKGNDEEYKKIVRELRESYKGIYTQDEIVELIKKETNKPKTEDDVEEATSIYKASDINSAFESGDNDMALEVIDDLFNTKVENYLAKAKKEAEESGKTFNERKARKEAETKAKSSLRSSMTSYWKPLYKEAYKSGNTAEKERIERILKASGLYGNSSEVIKTCREWRTERD